MLTRQSFITQTREKTILIVDDDRDIGEVLRSIILDQTNFRVVWIAESDLALEFLDLLAQLDVGLVGVAPEQDAAARAEEA